jgi:hypothetical protein
MNATKKSSTAEASGDIDVVEQHGRHRRGRVKCEIGKNISFNTGDLESYLFAAHDPVAYDLLLVAAAVEFADRTVRRPQLTWRRKIRVNIPVHDLSRWSVPEVSDALRHSLDFLTGDAWELTFYDAAQPIVYPQQGHFRLPSGIRAVMPFSDGLDSRAVAGLMTREMGHELLRVRLGTKDYDAKIRGRPFQAVPYKVSGSKGDFVESSARSRGFKFAVISGLAAYLANAGEIIVSESGQGSLGPSLVPVGQGYADYRNHPSYTGKIEQLIRALLGHGVRFRFPRIWFTKAETLRQFVETCGDATGWADTKSCWQQNRQSSVDGVWRHCGICAACILRRMSVHAVGLTEPRSNYVWEDLGAPSFEAGASPSFPEQKITGKMREYAIAGVLHMDHLAGLRSSPANARVLDLNSFKLARSLGLPELDVRANLDRFLAQHEREWRAFLSSLGESAFVAKWTASNP